MRKAIHALAPRELNIINHTRTNQLDDEQERWFETTVSREPDSQPYSVLFPAAEESDRLPTRGCRSAPWAISGLSGIAATRFRDPAEPSRNGALSFRGLRSRNG